MNAANSVDSTTRTVYTRTWRSTPPAAATTPTTSLAKRKPHGRRCRDRLSESMLAGFTPQDAVVVVPEKSSGKMSTLRVV